MSVHSTVEKALEQGKGILRLAPNWVPRSFCVPGRRIKLHPADYYSFGGERGGIDERWFSSTTPADNGPKTEPERGAELHRPGGREQDGKGHPPRRGGGAEGRHHRGPDLEQVPVAGRCIRKFFDNKGALPHHVHHRDQHAKLVGMNGKPESYYLPGAEQQLRRGLPLHVLRPAPGTTKDQVAECLRNFSKGDNKITQPVHGRRLEPGTGWDVPAGVLHAPGSLCTYEPQKASDIFAMYQSLTGDAIIPEELLWKNTPPDKVGNIDYMIDVLDWETNVDPNFVANHFMAPRPVEAASRRWKRRDTARTGSRTSPRNTAPRS